MNTPLQNISSNDKLPDGVVGQLDELGFATISGPLSSDRFDKLATAYDEVMEAASGPDFKVAGTTTRMSDLITYSSLFDDVFLFPPLLEAGAHVIGEAFKLSSFLGRTLRGGMPAQELHTDLPRDSDDAPLLGFILMIDAFCEKNGATRFVPGSHLWPDLPADRLSDARTGYPGQVLGCGDAGTMILFNGAIWHGHTANITADPRRSIQGYFVRRDARSGYEFRNRLHRAACNRMSRRARYLLSLDDD